jgi:hypothetical protein
MQTLYADGAAASVLAIGIATQSPAVDYTALAIYGLGAPAVHLGHGRYGAAALDFGLRVTGPVILSLTGFAIDMAASSPCSSDSWCFRGLAGASIGLIAGYVSVVVTDAAFIAREDAPPEDAATAHPRSTAAGVEWTVAPMMSRGAGPTGLAVAGTF